MNTPTTQAVTDAEIFDAARSAGLFGFEDSHSAPLLRFARAILAQSRAQDAPVAVGATHEKPNYLDITRSQGVPNFAGGPVPVLYSDCINGCMVRRDDIWLAKTSQLAAPVSVMGPKVWILETGAISLPFGHPSRLTVFEAFHDQQDAQNALAASEFDARYFAVDVPPILASKEVKA